MNPYQIFNSLVLGLVEGLTEFIPVSSTAHLILVGRFLGFSSYSNTFYVLIQFGAILAILSIHCGKFLRLAKEFPKNPNIQRFIFGILIALLPSAITGILLHSLIKMFFLNSLYLICLFLIAGGAILLLVDRLNLKPRYHDITHYPMQMYLKIGFCQCLALSPGISRSGSTIVGALLLGADKRSAAEFSFFLSIPTMTSAFAYDFMKNYDELYLNDIVSIVIGFSMAFVSGVFVVRRFLDYVSDHGYTLFGWWRIGIGLLGLIALAISDKHSFFFHL